MNYLLWANIYLAVLYVFYWIFLRKETFFQLNRWYLLSSALLSFTIPLLDLKLFSFVADSKIFSVTGATVHINQVVVSNSPYNSLHILLFIYLSGCLVSFIWFLYRVLLIKNSLKVSHPGDAFSFLNLIQVDPGLAAYETIIEHEQIHVKQFHSLDILFLEIIKIFNWFNPVIYLLIRSLKLTHEYIADQESNDSENGRIEYANLLVSQVFNVPVHSLKNNFFNKSFLTKRIDMLFKNKSKKSVLIRFSLLIPIMLVALAFQSKKEIIGQEPSTTSNKNHQQRDESSSDTLIFTQTEVMPIPPGGFQGFYQYIGENFTYPKEAIAAKLEGRMLISFIIEPDGSLSNIKSIKNLGHGTAEEAIRMLKASPKWTPGIQNGRAVRVQFVLPIQLNKKKEIENSMDEKSSSDITSEGMETT